MNKQFDLLKEMSAMRGPKLAVFITLILCRQNVSVKWLVTKTGYSEKPVSEALRWLCDPERGLVVRSGHSGFMIAGDVYQLPLYWNEEIEPAYPSPTFDQGQLPGFDNMGQKIFGQKNRTGKFPGLEARISALESEVFRLKALEAEVAQLKGRIQDQGFSVQEDGIIPGLAGETPVSFKRSLNNYQAVFGEESGEIPGLPGKSPVSETEGIEQKTTADVQKIIETGDFPVESGNILPETGNFPNLINSKNELISTDFKHVYLLISDEETGKNPVEEIPESAVILWKTVKTQLKGSMDRQTFATLLANAELIGCVDGHFTVKMQNYFTRDWAEKRLTESIEKILSAAGKPQSVSFVCENGTTYDFLAKEKEIAKRTLRDAEASDRITEWERTHLPMTNNKDRRQNENIGICNRYIDSGKGIEYSLDELRELLAMNPDPDVLRFVLPRASTPEAARRWASYDVRHLKYHLMEDVFKITMPALKNFTNDENITPSLIDYHYWTWYLKDRHENPDHKPGWYVDLIRKGAEKMLAEESEPLQYKYLG